ncbi:MAG: ABC transporter ATP-binding protein [Clostridiales bacterium]|nr:ABC transporter ATP-binding protein [Clostridium sp.]NLK24935.1 ABC transporter ATP-binding protein [Clostridiales bacterium]
MIKINNLSKEFKGKSFTQKVLKNINLEIKDGEFVTIMGPSGGGKSTLLNIIGMLEEPTNGEVFIDEKKVNYKSQNVLDNLRRENIGLIFQNPNLISSLNPLENLLIAMQNNDSAKDKINKAKELLKSVGLNGKEKSKITNLSGGEKQRVSIVRALVNNPKILLCDEPTGALDSKNGQNVIDILLKFKKATNATLIVVTHDETIGSLGEKRLYLQDGGLHESY